MRSLSSLFVVLLLVEVQALLGASSKGQGSIREFPNECPGEGGCQFGGWTAQAPVPIYSKRSTQSPLVIRLSKGDKVTGLSSIMVVKKLGACIAREKASAVPPTGGAETEIPAGTKLPLYFHDGEGRERVEFKGEAVSACCEGKIVCNVEPVTDLWLQVRLKSGRAGWTNQRHKFLGTSQYDN